MFKRIQLFFGVVVSLVVVGCSDTEELPGYVPGSEMTDDRLMVSVFDTTTYSNPQEALYIGEKVMVGDGSRSVAHSVESIVSVNDNSGHPLFYVTNYGEGQGFVIVSALKDYAPILASSETGRFDVDNCGESGVSLWLETMKEALAKADELPDSVKFRNRMEWSSLIGKKRPLNQQEMSRSDLNWESMVSDAIWQWQNDGYDVYPLSDFFPQTAYTPYIPYIQLPPEDLIYRDSYVSGRQVIEDSYVIYKNTGKTRIRKLMSTQWGQGWPYNNFIPYYVDNPTRNLGCTTVALGQILAYKRAVKNYDFNAMLSTSPNSTEISRFLYMLGTTIGIDYTTTNSSASYGQVVSALDNLNIAYQKNEIFDLNTIISSIYSDCPVYVRGQSKKDGGHAWVIDGFEENYNHMDWQVKLAPQFNDVTTMPFWNYSNWNGDSWNYRYWCNWGWYGKHDGYYLAEGFNTPEGSFNDVNKAIVNIKSK